MKVFRSILLVSAMLFLLAGCFDNEENPNNKEDNNNISNPNFSVGEYDGNTYTNKFLDIKLTLPDEWSFSSEEEIADIMDIDDGLTFGDDEYIAKVAEASSAYYAVASNPNTGENLSIISEKPSEDITIDLYISQLQEQLNGIESVNYEIGERGTAKLGNVEYTTLSVNVPDYNLIQKYFIHKVDEYYVGVIVTAQSEENINQVMTFFK